MNFTDAGIPLCGEETPWLLGLFDFSVAPPLLFYSYIPIIVASLALGIMVFLKGRKELQNQALLVSIIFFVLWVLNILIQWVTSPNVVLMFAWEMTALFEVGIFLSTIYLAHVFLFRKDMPWLGKVGLFAVMLVTIALTPTTYNVATYDLNSCEGVIGPLWTAIYALEPAIIALIAYLGLSAYRQEKERAFRPQIVIFSFGVVIFLTAFFLSNFYGELTKVYEFNLWGPVGMFVFLALLGYMILKYKSFQVKVLGAFVLMAALVLLIASQYFFVHTVTNYLLVSFTLALALGFGITLVRSVQKEVSQREHLERLTRELGAANNRLKELDQMKSEFLSIASHQLRAPITAVRGYAANVNEGLYGPIPDYLKEPLDTVQESARLMANSIEDYLNISRIEQGRMKYEKSSMDLADLAKKAVLELTPVAAKKKLALVADAPKEVTVNADIGKIKQVIVNLVDNAIKYTPAGSVTVSVSEEAGKARVTITDTGVGIPAEEIGGLFEKFKRARGANKVNTTGTGLGLYVAKQLTEGHGGTVHAESDGAGKGSRFILELPK